MRTLAASCCCAARGYSLTPAVVVPYGSGAETSEVIPALAYAQVRGRVGSISHAMTRLGSKGLIERRNDSTHRRAQFAVLTDDGAEASAAAAPGHMAAVRETS
jgi:hypothetical protein